MEKIGSVYNTLDQHHPHSFSKCQLGSNLPPTTRSVSTSKPLQIFGLQPSLYCRILLVAGVEHEAIPALRVDRSPCLPFLVFDF